MERTLYLGGGYPLFEVILGHFGHFGGFPVKTVCTPGLHGNPSQQRKRYTTHLGHLRGPPESVFRTPCVSRAQIDPREDL